MRKEGAIVLGAAAGLGLWAGMRYRSWRNRVINRLEEGSRIHHTARGAIEYAEFGEGSVLIVLHGSPGGYDQGLAIARLIGLPGFRYLAVSRPGYLRTPLETGRTYREQAEAIAALLDSLGIERGVIIGVSAGGPPALQFALHHAGRCAGLVLRSAITKRVRVQRVPVEILLAFLPWADAAGWMMNGIVKRRPGAIAASMTAESERELLPRDPKARANFIAMVNTFLPFSLRRPGMLNDVIQIEALSDSVPQGIRQPALIVHGTADDIVSYKEHALSAAEAIPDSELITLEGGSHFAGIFQAEVVRAATAKFLQALQVSRA